MATSKAPARKRSVKRTALVSTTRSAGKQAPTSRASTARGTARRDSARSAAQGVPADVFSDLLETVREGGQILRGKAKPGRAYAVDDDAPDVVALRRRMGLSQAQFALVLGISKRTLEGWEQGRRAPKGAERTLLRVVAKHPEALLDLAP